jgi:hypothetical protein
MATAVPRTASQDYNTATWRIASSLGVLLGISSMNHGVFEILQGDHPTTGYIIKALGPGFRWTVWTHGSEPAFTIVPDFLLTGILATLIGLLMIYWSLRRIHRPGGPSIFLLLGVTSFLVGGGMAQVLLFSLNWAAATRIRSSLGFWRWLLPAPVCRVLGKLWPWALAAAGVLFLAALEIAVVGYGPREPGQTQFLGKVLWRLALAIVLSLLLSFLCGFAHDVEARRRNAASLQPGTVQVRKLPL